MTTHTPEPWILEIDGPAGNCGSRSKVMTKDGAFIIADCKPDTCSLAGISEIEANARLIAAAPALLEALKLIRDSHSEARGFPFLWWGIMQEAIAKAEGR